MELFPPVLPDLRKKSIDLTKDTTQHLDGLGIVKHIAFDAGISARNYFITSHDVYLINAALTVTCIPKVVGFYDISFLNYKPGLLDGIFDGVLLEWVSLGYSMERSNGNGMRILFDKILQNNTCKGLHLLNCSFSDNYDIEALYRLVSQSNTLETLVITCSTNSYKSKMSDGCLATISKAILESHTLKELIIDHSIVDSVQNDTMLTFMASLKNITMLRTNIFSYVSFFDQQFNYMQCAATLAASTCLKQFSNYKGFYCSSFFDIYLCHLASNTTLEELDITRIMKTPKHATLIGNLIKSNTTLKTLKLGNLPLRKQGIDYVIDAMMHNSTLKRLEILFSEGMNWLQFSKICTYIATNTSLDALGLQVNTKHGKHFPNQVYSIFEKAVRDNPTLSTLVLSHFFPKQGQLNSFCTSLKTNTRLTALMITNNPCEYNVADCRGIATLIRHNSTLTNLRIHGELDWDADDINTTFDFATPLKHNSTLTYLELPRIYGHVENSAAMIEKMGRVVRKYNSSLLGYNRFTPDVSVGSVNETDFERWKLFTKRNRVLSMTLFDMLLPCATF